MTVTELSTGNACTGADRQEELRRRLAGYGISALAVTGALATGAAPASAQTIEKTILGGLTLPATRLDDAAVNFNTMGVSGPLTTTGAVGPGIFNVQDDKTFRGDYLASVSGGAGAKIVDASSGGRDVRKFAKGDLIEPTFTGDFGDLSFRGDGSFPVEASMDDRGFVGVLFSKSSNPGELFNGWLDVSVNPDHSLTLYAFGYNATNSSGGRTADPVVAGAGESAAPEPSALDLLLLGGTVGMTAYRSRMSRRRRQTA